jgi:tektin-4
MLCRVDLNGRQCATFTVADTNKKQNENSKELSKRVHDVHRWKAELEYAISAMSDEINTLELQRQRLKTAMRVLHMPESITRECLNQRTARLEPDLVRDKAEEELIKAWFSVFNKFVTLWCYKMLLFSLHSVHKMMKHNGKECLFPPSMCLHSHLISFNFINHNFTLNSSYFF